MKTETEVQTAIQNNVPLNARLWRNNVGCLQDQSGRYVNFGLCLGSSDLIGYIEVVITPEMVGKTIAQFAAVEVKKPGYKPSGKKEIEHFKQQSRFVAQINKSGGRAGFAQSLDQALKILLK